jgi:hypothetical protein
MIISLLHRRNANLAAQLSLWFGFGFGRRFVGFDGFALTLGIAQILSLESGIIAPIRGKCEARDWRSLNEPVRLIHLLTVVAETCHFALISGVGLPRR